MQVIQIINTRRTGAKSSVVLGRYKVQNGKSPEMRRVQNIVIGLHYKTQFFLP